MNALPKLSATEQAHSHQLIQVIQEKIRQAGGKIAFSDFMQACLYTPQLGYYSAGAIKFGPAGDFVTAPEISDLFGQTLAEYYTQLKKQDFIDKPLSIIELGAGTGKLAYDILSHLTKQNNLPSHYYILEISADLKHKQQNYLQHHLPDYIHQITWLSSLDNLPHFNGNGLIIANEVLDALPVDLFKLKFNANADTDTDLELYQTFIINHLDLPNTFQEIHLAADPVFKADLNAMLNLEKLKADFNCSEYHSEINTHLFSWLSGIEKIITHGQLIFIDYGFGLKEYYHPARHMGTLMCHYKHRAHSDFLLNIGLQDITAHVNFTQVALAAKKLNLRVDNFSTQAEFLLSQNLALLAEKKIAQATLSKNHTMKKMAIANEIQVLTAPHEMGELFKVLILHKGETSSIDSGRSHFHRL